jgi:hypothetical protein
MRLNNGSMVDRWRSFPLHRLMDSLVVRHVCPRMGRLWFIVVRFDGSCREFLITLETEM